MASTSSKKPYLLSSKEVAEILPHRFPFLLVDAVSHIDLENREIIGIKNVTINEPFFQGHFPEAPIMPGVLLLEALAQIGGILIHQAGYGGKIAVFLNIAYAKFRSPVLPGDVLHLHAKALHISRNGGKIKAKVVVRDKTAVEAELSCALVDKSTL